MPYVVARFNKRVTNRFIEPIARRSPGFAVVHHRGRRSGTAYRTPVNVFAFDEGQALVVLTYGPKADWFQNVLRGNARVETKATSLLITAVDVVDRVGAWPSLPWFVRLALRVLRVHDFARLTLARSEAPIES